MAKVDVLDILKTKKMDPLNFHFDSLWIPPMQCYLSAEDVEALRKIATSVRLSSKIQQKYKMIDDIMRARGFKRFSAGTNRVVYRFLEDTRFLVKIAVDKVGMQDNPMEYKNQFLLQPFVTKMFYVSPCGTVGFSERVLPIKNKEEFKQIASDVFDILVSKILGLYVVEDVGTKYFMNWGIRPGFGPVLLDYPYVYKLDGNKLFCNWVNPLNGQHCDGEIDYDAGFNHLVCTRCNKTYMATDLRDNSIDNKIIIKKGGFQMRVILKKGDDIISEPIPTDEVIVRPKTVNANTKNNLVVGIKSPDSSIQIIDSEADSMISNNTDYGKNSITVSINTGTAPSTNTINEILDNSRTWTPMISEDIDGNVDSNIVESDTTTDIVEGSVVEDHEFDNDHAYDNESDTTTKDANNIVEDDFEPDIVYASDIDIGKPKRMRNEKGQFIKSKDSEDNNGGKSGKNKKKKGNGTRSTFIPANTDNN